MGRIAYISCAGALERKEDMDYFENILLLCEAIGLKGIAPCLDKDFYEPDALSEVIEARMHPIMRADLFIADVGIPSVETRWDLQTAGEERIPAIIMCEEGIDVDSLVRAVPVFVLEEIRYKDRDGALVQLKSALYQWGRIIAQA